MHDALLVNMINPFKQLSHHHTDDVVSSSLILRVRKNSLQNTFRVQQLCHYVVSILVFVRRKQLEATLVAYSAEDSQLV